MTALGQLDAENLALIHAYKGGQVDAAGHTHAPPGPGGGQFTSTSGGTGTTSEGIAETSRRLSAGQANWADEAPPSPWRRTPSGELEPQEVKPTARQRLWQDHLGLASGDALRKLKVYEQVSRYVGSDVRPVGEIGAALDKLVRT